VARVAVERRAPSSPAIPCRVTIGSALQGRNRAPIKQPPDLGCRNPNSSTQADISDPPLSNPCANRRRTQTQVRGCLSDGPQRLIAHRGSPHARSHADGQPCRTMRYSQRSIFSMPILAGASPYVDWDFFGPET
jgi:hypothetical protein